ncbi:MAG: M28 family peptidase, partial [Phaeodactylibacter sp.]|nr:M28 family peptidase [Phaeodactylibacter sp.]
MTLKRALLSTWSMAFLLVLAFAACKNESPQQDPGKTTPPTPKKTYPVPAFNGDSAYVYVAKQVAFGSRVPGSAAHKACKEWLVSKFEGFEWNVIQQDFTANVYTGEKLPSTNIIGQYNPNAKKRIVLAAHWDSRHVADSPLSEDREEEPILGADDGGSGVGILLEVARQLQSNPIEDADLGVDIVLFDAEDYGESGGSENTWCLGSQYWSRNLHTSNYKPKFGILLDMVGSQMPRFTKDRVSMTFAPQVMNKVWKLAQAMGYGNLFV